MNPPEFQERIQKALGTDFVLERELTGGGMSRVFVASQPALRRQIVIKVLPPDTMGAVSVERFKREIQFAATLQHPHIVAVISSGEVDGLPFYTMPFVQGESLRSRLSHAGELPVGETVRILRDVAAALSYAHAQGVIHRDIKPDNVILSGGVAVVTDFGVAKAVDVASGLGGDHWTGLTSLGVALGTPAYMSPEQASADPKVDHRADIYSFGSVAYEMLTGSPPFPNRTPQQMLAAHVTETPETITRKRPALPRGLADLVMKCLEKRPADRPKSADEVLQALDSISAPSGEATPPEQRIGAFRHIRARWMLPIGLLATIALIAGYFALHQPENFIVGETSQITATRELEFDPAISADGRFVAYAAGPVETRRIHVQQIGGRRSVIVAPDAPGEQRAPSWSPDGTKLAFETPDGIYVAPALGGPAEIIAGGDGHDAHNGVWSHDGKYFAYATEEGVVVKPVDGDSARLVARGHEIHSLAWSPDGKRIAFTEGNIIYRRLNQGPSMIRIVPRDGGDVIAVTDGTTLHESAAWSADGRTLFYITTGGATRDIFQTPLRADGRPAGPPARLTTGLNPYNISVSRDGSRLVYSTYTHRGDIWTTPIPSALTLNPKPAPVTSENQLIEAIAISHDHNWLAFDMRRNGNADIYKVSLRGGEIIRMSTDPADDFQPRWSPTDSEIAFYSLRHGSRDVYVMAADGRNQTRVTSYKGEEYFPDWSRDGRSLAFTANPDGKYRMYFTTRFNGDQWSAPRKIDGIEANIRLHFRWSPDGTRLAVLTRNELFIINPEGKIFGRIKDPILEHDFNSMSINLQWRADGQAVYLHQTVVGGRHVFWELPLGGGKPRALIRFTLPELASNRAEFTTDGKNFYFTIANNESDIWVMDLKR